MLGGPLDLLDSEKATRVLVLTYSVGVRAFGGVLEAVPFRHHPMMDHITWTRQAPWPGGGQGGDDGP